MLQAPGKGIPVQMRTWGDCKAAYRLLHCAAVTRALLKLHFQHTRAAAAEMPVTLFVQDTTTLDFTQMEHFSLCAIACCARRSMAFPNRQSTNGLIPGEAHMVDGCASLGCQPIDEFPQKGVRNGQAARQRRREFIVE